MHNIDFFLNTAFTEKDITIETDPTLLKRVLHNLLDNAFKFTQAGIIELGYTIKNSDLLFYVKDSGIGIPKDECHKLFNSFTKIHSRKDKFYQGIGLGLKLSKKLLELLNGKIWVDSEVDKGSTFCFTIPYDRIQISAQQ
jgi:signal transduction histidine kinase